MPTIIVSGLARHTCTLLGSGSGVTTLVKKNIRIKLHCNRGMTSSSFVASIRAEELHRVSGSQKQKIQTIQFTK